MDNNTKNLGLKLFRLVLIAGLAVHFAIIGLHLMPDNPIKHQYADQIRGYVYPYFGQSWKLFAPNPVNSNLSIMIQFQDYKNGKAASSQWLDICKPLIDERRNNFWSPSQRILKTFSGSVMNLLENRSKAYEYVSKEFTAKDSLKSARIVRQAIEISAGHKAILSYSRFAHNNYMGANKISPDSSFVIYRVIESKFPRFSKRDLDHFDLNNYKYSQIRTHEYRIL
ncbi:DUF5819 family protein [Hymenobacter elongatus]|uniref:Uncharacterized protein n=1 Tax=Hymenobacter elongatus TaxID=877208 RepID=A0A4Z0PQH7_9BACT|nr:DUF5819 family protein [Hymenobacter elongatus]TGE18302.1 hypothetical protein E5J99_05195 [Hymenobacter elongatus]